MKDQRTGKIGIENYPRLLEWIERGDNSLQIADRLNCNPETVRKFARKRGLTIQGVDMSMENHPAWTGGHTLDGSGYLLKRVHKDSEYGYLIRAMPKRGKRQPEQCGYAPVHRIVMHDKLGRKLERGEVVDHIDGNKRNNDPSNLRLFPSNAEHLKVTLKGKVPKWTPEGFARITGRPKKIQHLSDQP